MALAGNETAISAPFGQAPMRVQLGKLAELRTVKKAPTIAGHDKPKRICKKYMHSVVSEAKSR